MDEYAIMRVSGVFFCLAEMSRGRMKKKLSDRPMRSLMVVWRSLKPGHPAWWRSKFQTTLFRKICFALINFITQLILVYSWWPMDEYAIMSTFAGRFVTLTPQCMERLRASSNLMFNAFKISGEVQRSQRQVLDLRRRAVEIAEASHVVEFQRQILMSAMMQACNAKGKARSDLLRVMVGEFTFLRGIWFLVGNGNQREFVSFQISIRGIFY